MHKQPKATLAALAATILLALTILTTSANARNLSTSEREVEILFREL